MSDRDVDEGLVERAQAAGDGDYRAFQTLVGRHEKFVHTNCRHMTHAGVAEDLTQEVFVKAYFALKRFERRASFRTWIKRIKVNHCLNFIEKQKRHPHQNIDELSGQDTADVLTVQNAAPQRLERGEVRTRIRAVLDAMPEKYRVPLILSDLDELPYQEIADRLEIKLSTVKMRVKRAREDFRARYRQRETVEAAKERSGP